MSLELRGIERIRKPRYYPAVNSIRILVVSDDVEENDRAVQVAAIGGAFVLLVLPERAVLLRE